MLALLPPNGDSGMLQPDFRNGLIRKFSPADFDKLVGSFEPVELKFPQLWSLGHALP